MRRARKSGGWRGSARWGEGEAREAVAAHATSGLSAAAFCRREGIKAFRFWWWRKRLSGRPVAGPGLLRVHVRDEEPREVRQVASAVEIVVAGKVVRVPSGFDAGELRRIVSALE